MMYETTGPAAWDMMGLNLDVAQKPSLMAGLSVMSLTQSRSRHLARLFVGI